ncbi:MAG: type II toxin-antitoxin system PemK/MazF family toxin [Blastocatellia bacterium]
MATPSAGDVVVVRFPFSDLTNSKLRPAIVLASAGKNDWVLCQITSKAYADASAIEIKDDDFEAETLHLTSYARPGKLFTSNEILIASQIGSLKKECFEKIVHAVIQLIQSGH